jgi:hypothetical protein
MTGFGPLLPELEPRPDLRQLDVLPSLSLLVCVVAEGHKVLVVCKRDHPPATQGAKLKLLKGTIMKFLTLTGFFMNYLPLCPLITY